MEEREQENRKDYFVNLSSNGDTWNNTAGKKKNEQENGTKIGNKTGRKKN